MGFTSALLNGILGLIFPPYSLFSGIVKYVTEEETSGFPILVTTTLGTVFPVVGDIVGELITEEIKETIEKNKFDQLLKKYPACVKCGQIDPYGLFNAKGERLCRACFRKQTRKIMLVSSVPIRCERCGKLTKEYFIDNNKVVCEDCLAKGFMVPNSITVIREDSFEFAKNYRQQYQPNYLSRITPAYHKNYRKGY